MNIEEAVALKFTVLGAGRYRTTAEHDSLVLDTAKNTFYWNSRGFGGSVYTFLTKVLSIPETTAKVLASPPLIPEAAKAGITNQKLHLLAHQCGLHKRDFWYARGYTDAVIDLYQLGYLAGAYTIPFVEHGILKALTYRTPDKLIFEERGSSKSLFGLDQLTGDLILLVESPLDVPILRMAGYNALAHNYGANNWDSAWNKFLYNHQVYVIPDNDTAGQSAIKQIEVSCKVCQWPKGTPKKFDINKLYLNNPAKFKANVDFLLSTAIPIEFMRY